MGGLLGWSLFLFSNFLGGERRGVVGVSVLFVLRFSCLLGGGWRVRGISVQLCSRMCLCCLILIFYSELKKSDQNR